MNQRHLCNATVLLTGICLWAGPVFARQLITQAVDDSLRVTIQSSTHPLAIAKYDRGPVTGDLAENRILLALRRSPEQEQDLQNLFRAQLDLKSAQYHKWLTPEEYGQRFGADPQDVAAISAWLSKQGFQVQPIAAGRSYIEFSGTAAQVQQAFRTSIHRFNVKGEAHYANTSDPQIPEALAPAVEGIVSLHDFHSRRHSHVLKTNPNFTQTGSEHYLTPYDYFTVYHETPLLTGSGATAGAGQTIAIVSRSNLSRTDLSTFRSYFLPSSYPALPLVITVDGTDPGEVQGDNGEAALDVEWSGAIAPQATVNMVVAGSTNTTDGVDLSAAYIVNHNLAPVMSASFGSCEAAMTAAERQFYANLWQQASMEGISVMVSSGDSGSAGCEGAGASGDFFNPTVAQNGLNVNGLASTPYNLAVGGNEFNDAVNYGAYWSNTNGAENQSALGYIPEFVWNESCSPNVCSPDQATLWGGGGGASKVYAKPSWQTGVPGIPADGVRDVPDVSLTAAIHDGYFVYLDGGFSPVGGTSAASPSFAGIMALVNQKTGQRQGLATKVLYSLAAANAGSIGSCNSTNQPLSGSNCVFYDVTQGSNVVPCLGGTANCDTNDPNAYGTLTGYSAGFGFDLATGLGSVNIGNFVNAWAQATDLPAVNSLSPGAGSGASQTFHFSFNDSQGWQHLAVMDVLINNALDGRNACYVAYVRPSNTVYLVANDGSTLLPGIVLNGSGSVSNSQCTVFGSGSAASGSGNTLNLTLNISFASSFGGNKVIYAAAGNQASHNSGWVPGGVWQVPGAPATALKVQGMTPNSGAGHSHLFTFTFSDTNGWQDLGVMDMLLNNYLDGVSACYVAYVRASNTVYLVADDGATLPPGIVLNGTGSLSNSQCTISGAGSSATASGNTLTLKLNYTFNSSFAGDRIFYLATGNAAQTSNTGWQSLGSWTAQ